MMFLTGILKRAANLPWYWWIILALISANGAQGVSIKWKARKIATLEQKNSEMQAQIDEWKRAAVKQVEAVADAVQVSETVKIVYRDKLQRIESAPIASDCTLAVDWLRVEAPRLGTY